MLRWLAIAQPINREQLGVLEYLASVVGLSDATTVGRILEDLSRRRVVTLYGINRRQVEVRPDVFRDHLLLDWLTYESSSGARKPSPDAQRVARRLAENATDATPSPTHVSHCTFIGTDGVLNRAIHRIFDSASRYGHRTSA